MDSIYKVIFTEVWCMAAIPKKYYLQSDSNLFKVPLPNINLASRMANNLNNKQVQYSGDLNNGLVQYLNGPKQSDG